jgi:small GTP-binding protein
VEIDRQVVKYSIWDTAGQERFKTITKAHYRNAHGIVLVYGCDALESFNNVENWMEQINQHASRDTPKILVANKSDLKKPQVTPDQGRVLAAKFSLPFFETSALSGINVSRAFMVHIQGTLEYSIANWW